MNMQNVGMQNIPEQKFSSVPAIFLDRDGVVCRALPRGEYLVSPDEFELLPGIDHLIRAARVAGFRVIVVTNQGQIAKGLLNEDQLEMIHEKMRFELAKLGVGLDAVYVCPHHDTDHCSCRKPKSGLLEQAAHDLNLDLKRSLLVGDSDKDIGAGKTAGCRTIFLKNEFNAHELEKCFPDEIVDDFSEINITPYESAPLISIVMATYNRAGLIPKTFQSILAQTVDSWELLISDDGSSDETYRIVQSIVRNDPRVRFLRHERNWGISKNYNAALLVSRGHYIAMIDDDDPWCDPEKLAKQIAFLANNSEYVGCGGGVIVTDRFGVERYRYLKPESDAEIRASMLLANPMANSTTLFLRSAGEHVGWYDESIRYSGDRDFWMKMGSIGKLRNFPEYFSFYTMTGENTSIRFIRPHLKISFFLVHKYRHLYPGYLRAILVNFLQYSYALLPVFIRKSIHASLAKLKHSVFK